MAFGVIELYVQHLQTHWQHLKYGWLFFGTVKIIIVQSEYNNEANNSQHA